MEERIISTEILEKEIKRIKKRRKRRKAFLSLLITMLITASILVFVLSFWIPMIRISGISMYPTLEEDDIGLCWKHGEIQRGDIVAFQKGETIIVKRVIALPGETVFISDDGSVFVNGKKLEENYITGLHRGNIDIQFPYTVSMGQYFVMGDNREHSLDSRSKEIGCISEEQIIGKLFLRVWPIKRLGLLKLDEVI